MFCRKNKDFSLIFGRHFCLQMSAVNWIGFLVNVDCGEIGVFEGRVSSLNEQKGSVCLRNATLDGKFVPCSDVTIRISEIEELRILSAEAVELNTEETDRGQLQFEETKEEPLTSKKSCTIRKYTTPDQKKSSGSDSKKSLKKRTEECFGTPLDTVKVPDFDFEKNLKLFDKEAIFEKLKGMGKKITCLGSFPSYVMEEGNNSAVSCKKSSSGQRKLKHDENVLEQEPVSMRQIVAPVEHTGREYHTDEGVVVPSISMELRNRLIKESENMGLTSVQRNENAGLCACQMALQLVGGSNRLTQRNAHQPPHIVVIAGPNTVGIHSICAARHLANHKVAVCVYVPVSVSASIIEILVPHLALFFHTGCRIISRVEELPTHPVDLVMHALIGPEEESAAQMTTLMPVNRWANNNKAPVLILDPCHRVRMFGVEPKWSLAFGLPLIDVPSDCRMYLADIGIPNGIFSAVDIKYTSPFGEKFVIALND